MDIVELYNPLYFVPIVGVVFCALLVYAFGFKTPSSPPILTQFQDERKTPPKKKKTIVKDVKAGSGKPQQNGHIISNNVTAAKASPAKSTNESKSAKSEAKSSSSASKSNNGIISPKDITKRDAKRKSKAKNVDDDVNDVNDVEDVDAGEWVETVSRRERKNRKLKEEQITNDVEPQKDKGSPLTPKKSKKGKENKDSNAAPVSPKKKKNTEKIIKEKAVSVQKEESVKGSAKTNIPSKEPTKSAVIDEDIIAEDPDVYAFAKEQRKNIPKKLQKQRSNKRGSEPDALKVNPIILESESKANTDKLTAAIVANYEDQNKPDSLSTANNKKKKEKNKKKQNANDASENSQKKDNSAHVASRVNHEIISEKSEGHTLIPEVEVTSKPEEDDFKVATSKKRRARRE